MCGIAGEIGAIDGDHSANASRQLAALRHRGPDAEGASDHPGAWIGQTRLAIIDLQHGDPPITNEDGTIGVALNGEIYNYRALRAELRRDGHHLGSDGDTEVLAHLAEGTDPAALASHLEGMFAFAIWDERRRRLILGRDRFGKKPLYYWCEGDRLVFASEIKSLLANPRVPRRLRQAAIADFLTFGYVPMPETFFEGVRSVPPGHVLVATAGSEPRLECYWEPRYPGAGAGAGSVTRLDVPFDAVAAMVRDKLRSAVERRLIADVPLGAFLSGGIDSSSVVALMAQASDRPVATFTIGFEDSEGYDERQYARAVAERYRTDHTEFVVKPEASELIERLVWHYDEPFGDSSALPTYMLSELTRGHVTVALCGDGGDELFAGYERFAAALAVSRYESLPQPLRAGVRRGAELLPPSLARGRAAKLRRLLVRSDLSAPMALLAWVSYVPVEWKEQLLAGASAGRIGRDGRDGIDAYQDIWRRSSGAHPLDRLLDLNIRTYLLDDLLPKVDRMSMAHGLEVRAPFLDHELAELAFRLTPSARLRGLSLKRVLRAAVADLIPREILERPKRGFGVPIDRWFRHDLAPYVRAMLCGRDTHVRAHLSGTAIDALVAEHQAGTGNHGDAIWSLLTLEIFLRRHGW
jgi:asparagine synthase (glutamine-hydrolysing)